jgi:rhodanese-related sulfurtransferase
VTARPPGLARLAAAVMAAASRLIPRRLRRTPPAVDWIEAETLAEALAGSAAPAVIDVRGADEVAGPLGRVPGAANIPVDALVATPALAGPPGDRPVVLVCRTDRRSAAAAAALRGAGYRRVAVLRGGMERWNALGLTVERAAPQPDGRATEPDA